MNDPAIGLATVRGLSWFFGIPGQGVTSTARRQRHVFVKKSAGSIPAPSGPQKQSDPEGGIPSGSLEVTWKVKDLEG